MGLLIFRCYISDEIQMKIQMNINIIEILKLKIKNMNRIPRVRANFEVMGRCPRL